MERITSFKIVHTEALYMGQRRVLVDVVLRLSSCKNLDEIVGVLRETTRELAGADGITIVLRDVDKCFYAEEDAVSPLWKGKRFPISACISGWCMLNRQQVVIRDIYADNRIPHDAYRSTFVKSLAMTPIRSAEPVGAIGAYWAENHEATTEELATLQALGDSAAMALTNAQLIQELKETSRRKDAFLSMLAHELRNPLAPIRNGLHLLRLESGYSETIEQATQMMDRQVIHLSRIVDDLLDMARINNGKVVLRRVKLDLASLLRQCVSDHRQEIDAAGVSLKLEVPLTPIWISADETRVTQIFDNLLDNARKYTPAGGTVSVCLRADPSKGSAVVDIEDTGVGIAPHILPRVFETFMQADTSLDRTSGGLGLGLAIATGLVRLHEGAISVHSDGLGLGSRFTVTLPNLQNADSNSVVITDRTKSNPKQLRLLIIEDNRDSADSLQKLLQICGYGTTVAYDGSEGVDRALAERPDVVLCDIGLPKLDGYEVATILRRSNETAQTRLIAVTGYGSEEDRLRCRTAGFDAHMVKPINLEELLGHLKSGQPA